MRRDLRDLTSRTLELRPARFVVVGVSCTIAYAALYLALRGPLGPGLANAVSLAITAIVNTAAHRRFTFRVRGREQLADHHARGAVIYLVTLTMTSGALFVLHRIDDDPARWLEVVVLVLASLTATVSRYLALRSWVFERGPGSQPSP